MGKSKYQMTISRTTVDKLGIKLYDKASAVITELISNAYDADAEKVTVKIPLDKWLASQSEGQLIDQGFEISVGDNGIGMSPDVINDFYLKVGVNPREDAKRGPKSLIKNRPRMGRKGIGKLAPFGICKVIEVKSAGGEKTEKGYLTAHFILNYDDIWQKTDAPYSPTLGKYDGAYSEKSGTVITMRNFLHRRTPDMETFHRQVARRFGLELADFKIEIVDTVSGQSSIVGSLPVEIDENTKIIVDDKPVSLEDGTKLPVRGWIAYASDPYSNVEVAGVRIYARGKFVSNTRDFGLNAGFTGEFTIRSYLVGVIHADWLDADNGEDLVQSGRGDILWDSEIGAAFQSWGQALLRELGKKSWSPLREKAKKVFFKQSNIEEAIRERFKDKAVADSAIKLAGVIGNLASRDALKERPEYVERLKELVLTVAPHKMIVDKLSEVEAVLDRRPLEAIAQIFNDAKLAESASLGQVALERIDAINKLVENLDPQKATEEKTLQKLLEGAPWLINPQWTVLQANKSFENMREAFEEWWLANKKENIITSAICEQDAENKRPDFLMLHVGRNIEIVEIKRPQHALTNEEFDRIMVYWTGLNRFLADNPLIRAELPKPHITLVCDGLNLSSTYELAYNNLKEHNDLDKKTWRELLTDCRKVHEDFLTARESSYRCD